MTFFLWFYLKLLVIYNNYNIDSLCHILIIFCIIQYVRSPAILPFCIQCKNSIKNCTVYTTEFSLFETTGTCFFSHILLVRNFGYHVRRKMFFISTMCDHALTFSEVIILYHILPKKSTKNCFFFKKQLIVFF